jgi:hypothetical protein
VLGVLLEPIRGIKLAFLSGVVWLSAFWLMFGNSLLDAIGRTCGDPSSAACIRHQSPTIHLVVVAVNALGPVGSTAALAIIATLVGGTTNFIFALISAGVWQPKDDPVGSRKRKRIELIDLLMGWATPIDLVDHAEWNSEWQEAQRIRGEGLTRITTFPGLVAVACTLALRVSPLFWIAAASLIIVLVHGIAAFVRSATMYEDLRAKRAARTLKGSRSAPKLFDPAPESSPPEPAD